MVNVSFLLASVMGLKTALTAVMKIVCCMLYAIVWDANSIAYHTIELYNYTQSIRTVDFNSI